MLTLRLQRRGRKNDPSFRVIAVESKRAAKTGSVVEALGTYDPRVDRIDLKADRILYWMKEGATVSDTLHNLLVTKKIINEKKINVLPRKSPPKVDAPAAAPAAAAKATEVPAEVVEEKVAEGDNVVAAETPAE